MAVIVLDELYVNGQLSRSQEMTLWRYSTPDTGELYTDSLIICSLLMVPYDKALQRNHNANLGLDLLFFSYHVFFASIYFNQLFSIQTYRVSQSGTHTHEQTHTLKTSLSFSHQHNFNQLV